MSTGFFASDKSCFFGGCHDHHPASLLVKGLVGYFHHCGFARPGRADDGHEWGVASDSDRGGGLLGTESLAVYGVIDLGDPVCEVWVSGYKRGRVLVRACSIDSGEPLKVRVGRSGTGESDMSDSVRTSRGGGV